MTSQDRRSVQRATSLGPHDFTLLVQWGDDLYEAFGEMPYLVGSVARADDDWRDVDVRMLDVPEFAPTPLMRRVVNMALTLWGRQVTGLPIDVQLQDGEEFHKYDGERRNAIGIRERFGAPTFEIRAAASDQGVTEA